MFFLFKFIFFILPLLIGVAFLTLLERKFLGLVGIRLGPNKVSFMGFLQPITDAMKLFNKQINTLSNFYFFFYYICSFLMFFSSIYLWSCSFFELGLMNFKFSLIFLMIVLSFNSLNSILCGWSTYGKFSLLGSIRTVAQLISYEAVLYLCFFFFIIQFYCFNLYIYSWYFCISLFFVFPICFFIWVPSFLAELNRTPYDFSESESELVSGFNTEFGSGSFTLMFLSEYSNILFFCLVSSFFFFSNYLSIFFFFFFFFVIWIRSVLCRFRFDKLMMLAWTFYIPFLTMFFLLCYLFYF